jgi:FXSXX-COOH protein
MITLMTPEPRDIPVFTQMVDYRTISLQEMPDLPSRTLDEAVQRVLPGLGPTKTRGAFFNSSV